ncbi:LOW QUALITY PROTEIN: uncharacterized protein [Bemisia tabaci]|uniref:LOW QUALITY PROTEIN: uncharacterized protein n=1 Tax=Bemisia tabaci TaxID=7038 RepID=UPI003B282E18
MLDRLVALQLLLCYWLATVLPPPSIFGYASTLSPDQSYNLHQSLAKGRKFGGYRIVPRSCKDLTTANKATSGVCMFNYECTQKGGSVVGACMDGFLFGACCRLPPGTVMPTLGLPSSSAKPIAFSQTDKTVTVQKPINFHPAAETILLHKNGSIVDNLYSPEELGFHTKPQLVSLPPTTLVNMLNSIPKIKLPNRTPSSSSSDVFNTTPKNAETHEEYSTFDAAPTQHFDVGSSVTELKVSAAPLSTNNINGVSLSKNTPTPTSKATQKTESTSVRSTAPYHSYQSTTPAYTVTDDNLILVPTLTADDKNKHESINHIITILNDTNAEPVPEPFSQSQSSTQSLYTWVSIEEKPEKTAQPTTSSYFSTLKSTSSPRPSTGHYYHDTSHGHQTYSVYGNTHAVTRPTSTIHHIPTVVPGHPEVSITPKPQIGTSAATEPVPTVIVLGSLNGGKPSKKPGEILYSSLGTTTHSVKRPGELILTGNPNVVTGRPPTGIIITARPQQQQQQQQSSYGTASVYSQPITTTLASKPVYHEPVSTSHPYTSTTEKLQDLKPPSRPATKPTADKSPSYVPSHNLFSTAKPLLNKDGYVQASRPTTLKPQSKPIFTTAKPVPPPIPSTFEPYVTIGPEAIVPDELDPVTEENTYISVKPFYPYPSTLQDAFINSTEDLIAFPPVRDPNHNISTTQGEKPLLTATTTFVEYGDEDIGGATPQFVVDENLDNKVHSFVEKIVQSLQGNFEDLEKVLITGVSRPNVTLSNEIVTTTKKPKPSKVTTKRPTTNKKPTKRPSKPTSTLSGSKPLVTRPPRPTTTEISKPIIITTSPSPTITTPSLFQPSVEPDEYSTLSPTKASYEEALPTTPSARLFDALTIENVIGGGEEENDLYSSTEKPPVEPDYRRECGVRPLVKKNGRIVGGKGSTFGEWPWQVLVREATWLGLFTKNKCGGVLITQRHVITAAHCQPGFLANLVAVFGEYDISGELESKRSVSKNVRRVIVHRQYDAATFENDIALLELESPITFDAHIVPICMPRDDEDFTGKIATVTGWGRLKYGGGVPSVLQEVQVPVIENNVCQEMFHTAGHAKTILSSFLCAGYANGQRDSCEGDSGGPLMIEREDGHWVLAGTVSHGIKCAAPYLPGVYMRTTYYKPWLQTITGVA